MSRGGQLGQQTKWGANVSVNTLRQSYDSILLEPIPERLLKVASVLAEVCARHLIAVDALQSGSEMNREQP